MNAKEYMHNIRSTRRKIRAIQDQIERDRNLAGGMTAIRYDKDRVQTSPVGDRMADIVAKIIETTDKLEQEIQSFQLMEEDAISILLNLRDEHERVLTYHYLDDLEMSKVAMIMGYNERYIYDIKDRALEELEKELKKTEQN